MQREKIVRCGESKGKRKWKEELTEKTLPIHSNSRRTTQYLSFYSDPKLCSFHYASDHLIYTLLQWYTSKYWWCMVDWLSSLLIWLAKSVPIALHDPLVVGSVARLDLPSTPYPTMYPMKVDVKSPSPLPTLRPAAGFHFWKLYIAHSFDEQMLQHSAMHKETSYLAMEPT